MTIMGERWQSYWADKTTPQYVREDDAHYREYAEELRLLFPDPFPARVLEIGCGNGALHRHLAFDKCDRYVGVDFSERMLGVFHETDPGVELVHADGPSYRSNDEFDLIFSSQVAQYWSPTQLADHVDNALTMLSARGAIIISGIPWSRMRFAYARGDMTGGRRRSLPTALLGFGSELVRKRLGAWYDFPELSQVAARSGLRVQFYGSIHYAYRFHAVLRP
ncbi:class I SAM-dependent methyltransferase [Pseudonocardia aurantiaca]|uniref:Class I SAM-dependent methyltransferase n=1 Tax=Pseudonocardia aurantiaca TaxID=75290 RepID=A0ABW4FP29_9PSEU